MREVVPCWWVTPGGVSHGSLSDDQPDPRLSGSRSAAHPVFAHPVLATPQHGRPSTHRKRKRGVAAAGEAAVSRRR